MLKTRLALLLSPIVLLSTATGAIGQQANQVLFRETFQGPRLENFGGTLPDGRPVRYNITTSVGSSNIADANNPNLSQSVCLTASQDTSLTTTNGNANNVPGCAPGLTGLPATGDPVGQGGLRLTSNRVGYRSIDPFGQLRPLTQQGERGSFIIDNAFPRDKGLTIEFDFFIYNGRGNGTPPGADGISFFLLDGNEANPRPGAFGGSLGYAQANPSDFGVSQGFLGIGFDVFGNFSAGTEGRNGGIGFTPDAIVLRGSGNGSIGYPFISSVPSSSIIGASLDDDTTIGGTNEKIRSQGVQGRHARINISKTGFLTVEISTVTGDNVSNRPYSTVISNLSLNPDGSLRTNGQIVDIPSTFKFGFAASTGFSTAIHEIRNFVVTSNEPPTLPIVRNLRLVKRITALTRSGVRTEFNQFIDDPNTLDDNRPDWSQAGAIPVGLITVDPSLAVQSNDEIEYTIYYLAEGDTSIADVNVCDAIPTNTTFVPNSGLIRPSGGSVTSGGTFFSPLQPIPNPSACSSPSNNNGSILYSLGNLSTQLGQNFGYTRFRTRVNGAQP